MRYKVGKKVDFYWDNYDYYYNTDLMYEGTERLTGIIESYDDKKGYYSINVNGHPYSVKENEIVSSKYERIIAGVLEWLNRLVS